MRAMIPAGLLAACLANPAAAAPDCSISPIRGLTDAKGATATMQVFETARSCRERLWVLDGVIPYTRLQQTTLPQHGKLLLNSTNEFSYVPLGSYTGPDVFDIIAFGNDKTGGAVTGILHMKVTITGTH